MKTDRELLELAARAAGIEHVTPTMIEWGKWNPLTDDGDALRLAVRLRLECMYEATESGPCHCQYWIGGEGFKQVTEEITGDPYASTRRAIVRAAAAIGEGMK